MPYSKNKNIFIITSSAHFRQRVIKKSYKSGVTFASNYYHVSRNAIYEWRHKWDGTVKSLMDRSPRHYHHPNEDTESEKWYKKRYRWIIVATSRHNGKVERQHRIDEKRFYSKIRMFNLADGRKQFAKYNEKSNNIPKIYLNFKTPNEVLNECSGVKWIW